MGSAVAVERTEHSLVLDHAPEPSHDRLGVLLVDELGVVDIAGGVVHERNQIELLMVGAEPGVSTPIDVQHHPR